MRVGLRQGCAFSPILFVIFIDRILRRSRGGEVLQLRWIGHLVRIALGDSLERYSRHVQLGGGLGEDTGLGGGIISPTWPGIASGKTQD